MIYHITAKNDWQKAKEQGYYEAASLATEGFIHCSKINQVQGVLERYYSKQNDLLLLHIDEKKLLAPLKFEIAPSVMEDFPHVFGSINIDAVVDFEKIVQKTE